MRKDDRSCSAARESGFTFIELVIVLAVVALLAGVIAPNMMSVSKDAHAAKILKTYESIRTACALHFSHTGILAREYAGATYAGSSNHHLSMAQTTRGWAGPYIDKPLSYGDNPYGAWVSLYDGVNGLANVDGGFDSDGDGEDDVTTDCNVFVFTGVPESTAKLVNDSLDAGNLGEDWAVSGRVEWSNHNSGTLAILIFAL